MNTNFELFVALRYLRAKKNTSFVSVVAGFSFVGIALGVATLIVVLAVMDGFRNQLLDRILGLNGHILVNGINKPIKDFNQIAVTLKGIDGITSAFPIINEQVMVSSKSSLSGALVRGIEFGNLSSLEIISSNIVLGSINVNSKSNEIIMGKRLADSLGVTIGSKVNLISSKSSSTPFGEVPRSKTFMIGGLFNVGMYEYDSSYIFMPLSSAQLLFLYNDSVPTIEIRLEEPESVIKMREYIIPLTNENFYLVDWQQLNSSYVNALKVERNVMFLILSLIILIAAFNIISGLVMLVKDKSRDIAILRTVGCSKNSILRIFLYAGASIGLFGTTLGCMIGIIFAKNISAIQGWIESLTGTNLFAAEFYYLSKLPSNLVWSNVGSVLLLSITLSLLATIYPSWKAARLDPVEILRYE